MTNNPSPWPEPPPQPEKPGRVVQIVGTTIAILIVGAILGTVLVVAWRLVWSGLFHG